MRYTLSSASPRHRSRGGHYVFTVKTNARALYQAINDVGWSRRTRSTGTPKKPTAGSVPDPDRGPSFCTHRFSLCRPSHAAASHPGSTRPPGRDQRRSRLRHHVAASRQSQSSATGGAAARALGHRKPAPLDPRHRLPGGTSQVQPAPQPEPWQPSETWPSACSASPDTPTSPPPYEPTDATPRTRPRTHPTLK